MIWLQDALAQGRDPRLLGLALLVAGAGSYAACYALTRRTGPSASGDGSPRLPGATGGGHFEAGSPGGGRGRRSWPVAAAALALGAGTWLTYVLMVLGFFPDLAPAGDWATNGRAIALAGGGGLVAAAIAVRARPGYRDVLLAGAVFAGAVACTAFLSLSALTRPHKLAYELLPVTATVLLAAVLGGLGLAQAAKPCGPLQRLQGALCLALAQVVPVAAGLGSILSFSDWMAEADKPASLATEPVVVVLAACGLVVALLGIAGSAVDHHLALRSERESERLRQLADSAMEGILIHRAGVVLDANAAFCALVGAPVEAVRGRRVAGLFLAPPGGPAPWEAAGPGCERQEVDMQAQDGTVVPAEVLARAITYKDQPAQVLAVRDIRERRAAEERIRHLAHHDGLTGLANRTLFGERLRHALARAARAGERGRSGASTGDAEARPDEVAVLCLDLDRFKAVNDTLGHAAGDLLLQQVAARLREAVRAGDTVARMGGDEFVVVQVNGPQPQAAQALAARLIEALCTPFDLDGRPACVGTSVGVALYPRDGAEPESLLKRADLALYRAKSQGRGTSCFYDGGMDAEVRERGALARELRAAIGTDRLELHYQPIVRCEGGEVGGFEALMRWTRPGRGRVAPAEFIALAEEAGLIVPLGRWALESACRAAAAWPGGRRVAVNLSPAQVRGDDLPAAVADVLRRTGLPAERLELEVTERPLIGDADRALQTLRGLKALGARVVLDGFGAGQSSLSHLRRFPFDALKMDRSLLRASGEDPGARAAVEAILAMGRKLGLDVTADGVETAQQLDALRAQRCDAAQGPLLGRSMPADAVAGFLRERRLVAA